MDGCLQKHFNVSNKQIRNTGMPASEFIFL